MDLETFRREMEQLATAAAKRVSDQERESRHMAYDQMSLVAKAMEVRQSTVEESLKLYAKECREGTDNLKRGMDRLYLLVQGDQLTPGLVESQRKYQEALESRLDDIEGKQVESQKHRIVSEAIPKTVEELSKVVHEIVEERKLAGTSAKAYKHSIWIAFVIVSGAIAALWNVFTFANNIFHFIGNTP